MIDYCPLTAAAFGISGCVRCVCVLPAEHYDNYKANVDHLGKVYTYIRERGELSHSILYLLRINTRITINMQPPDANALYYIAILRWWKTSASDLI